jgi:hypothetical protein
VHEIRNLRSRRVARPPQRLDCRHIHPRPGAPGRLPGFIAPTRSLGLLHRNAVSGSSPSGSRRASESH